MRNVSSWFIAITFLLLSGTLAFADDKSKCLDGIQAIKTAIAKKPPKPVLDRLKRALDSGTGRIRRRLGRMRSRGKAGKAAEEMIGTRLREARIDGAEGATPGSSA
jgi:hypothetical protein